MNKPPVNIRRAQRKDIDSLVGLLEELFSIEEDFTFDKERQRKGLQLLLESPLGCVLAAEADNSVVGMCTGQLTISTAEGSAALLVEDVVVTEDWRGKGVGRQLLDKLAQWAAEQGANRMQLLADRTNKAGLDFYTRSGWQQTQLICLRKRQKPQTPQLD